MTTMKLYDASGREVLTLIDNENLPVGSHSRIFVGDGLPSGTYLVWLYTENQSSVMSISLTK